MPNGHLIVVNCLQETCMGDIVAKNMTDQLMLVRNVVQGIFFFFFFQFSRKTNPQGNKYKS